MRSPVLACLLAVVPTLTAGCVVVSLDGGDAETSTSETTATGDGDGSPGDGDGSPGDGDGAPGDGDGSPGDGDGDGDGDGAPDCAPRDPNVGFSYLPFDFGLGDPWEVDIDITCTVTQVDTTDGLYLLLDCPDAPMPVEIDISASPTFVAPLVGGETIQVRYVYEGPWWFNTYLRLDIVGVGHLLTLIDGDSLLPPDPFVFDPEVAMTPHYDLCTPIPDGCGDLERLALDFEINSEAASMLDGSYAIVGGDPGTEVWVVSAGHLSNIQCSDTPDEWYRVLITNTGWE